MMNRPRIRGEVLQAYIGVTSLLGGVTGLVGGTVAGVRQSEEMSQGQAAACVSAFGVVFGCIGFVCGPVLPPASLVALPGWWWWRLRRRQRCGGGGGEDDDGGGNIRSG
jgi:hypothetical protein